MVVVSSAMEAPMLQKMSVKLDELDGLVVRQVTQYSDVAAQTVGVPFEAKNKYQVFALPDGKFLNPSKNKNANAWYPSAQELKELDEIWFVQEESGFWNRVCLACIGCLNLRPLRLHFTSHGSDQFLGIRPYRIGGVCGCPLKMDIVSSKDNTAIGQVVENFSPWGSKCFESTCLCTSYTSVLPEGAAKFKYTLQRSNCCCGRVNNCCGATCFNETLIVDILDENDNLVGTITRFYAPGEGGAACCRACYGFVNFALKFPEGTKENDKILLLSAMMAQEYQFSRPGGDS